MHKATVLISASLLRAASADAHPVDEVVQGAYLTIAANEVRLELDITPGRANIFVTSNGGWRYDITHQQRSKDGRVLIVTYMRAHL
jgi:hypothetical protein